ncbi:MAG: VRR-NUC domain-containing protein [Clostridia bacterium]|nr:VRR-NUC domain-containing protein [Clostridia bacterium]
MDEKHVEQALRRAVQSRHGLALKFVSPGLDGVPDRLVLLPGGLAAFVEVKAPGKHLRPLQVKRKRQLESLGFQVYCLDHPDRIPALLNAIVEGGDAR